MSPPSIYRELLLRDDAYRALNGLLHLDSKEKDSSSQRLQPEERVYDA